MTEITINFTLQGGSEGGGVSDSTQPSGATARENAKTAFVVHQAMSVAKQLGSQVVNNYVSSIGSRTGNYVQQERVQTAMSVVGKVISIGTAFAANPILGAVALVSEGVNLGFQIAERNREIMWQNREAEQLRRRAGYNSNYNR